MSLFGSQGLYPSSASATAEATGERDPPTTGASLPLSAKTCSTAGIPHWSVDANTDLNSHEMLSLRMARQFVTVVIQPPNSDQIKSIFVKKLQTWLETFPTSEIPSVSTPLQVKLTSNTLKNYERFC